MKRKRLLLIFACLAAVLLAGYVMLRLTAPRHRINKENVEAIKKGMTIEEVESLLGAPPGVYASATNCGVYVLSAEDSKENPGAFEIIQKPGLVLIQEKGGKEWVGEDVSIWILFDDVGRVSESYCGYMFWTRGGGLRAGRPEPFLDKLRR